MSCVKGVKQIFEAAAAQNQNVQRYHAAAVDAVNKAKASKASPKVAEGYRQLAYKNLKSGESAKNVRNTLCMNALHAKKVCSASIGRPLTHPTDYNASGCKEAFEAAKAVSPARRRAGNAPARRPAATVLHGEDHRFSVSGDGCWIAALRNAGFKVTVRKHKR